MSHLTQTTSYFGIVQAGYRRKLEEVTRRATFNLNAPMNLDDSEDETSSSTPPPNLPSTMKRKRALGRTVSAPLSAKAAYLDLNRFTTVPKGYQPRAAKRKKMEDGSALGV